MFFFGLSTLVFKILLVATLATTCLGDVPQTSTKPEEPDSINEVLSSAEILISNSSEIPTKEIVDFKNLVIVVGGSTPPYGQGRIQDVVSDFLHKVQALEANGVINFRIVVVSNPTSVQTYILYGNAVVVE